MAWLRQHQRAHTDNAASTEQGDKVLRFPDASARLPEERGQAALELIYRAAEAVRGVEDRARSIAEDAVGKLQQANDRIQGLEAERRAAEVRIQEAEEALKRAAARIAVAEDRLIQAERLAKAADARASEAEKALMRIEDAVRTRLLGPQRRAPGRPTTA
jgi:chromosome segregation ATPase